MIETGVWIVVNVDFMAAWVAYRQYRTREKKAIASLLIYLAWVRQRSELKERFALIENLHHQFHARFVEFRSLLNCFVNVLEGLERRLRVVAVVE
jgi:hypothetical protein